MISRHAVLLMTLAACRSAPPGPGSDLPDSTRLGPVESDTGAHGPGRVALSETAHRAAGIVTQLPYPVTARDEVTALVVPGQVEADPSRVALITPRTEGRLERLTAAVGQRVQRGQTVAHILSPAFVTAQSELLQAARRASRLSATSDSAPAQYLLVAARRRLALLGASPEVISRVEQSGETEELLALTAPFDGSLVEALAMPGAAVSLGTPVFRLVDLAEVDVVASVPEVELPHLAVGRTARVLATAYPGAPLDGRIERIRDELDPATRTVAAVIHVPNPRGTLKPGMFATVRIAVPLLRRSESAAGPAAGLLIPESAIVVQGRDRFVFVEIGPRTYERRLVEAETLGDSGAGARRALVRSGLMPGDRVVVAGAFVLKSELAKGELEEH